MFHVFFIFLFFFSSLHNLFLFSSHLNIHIVTEIVIKFLVFRFHINSEFFAAHRDVVCA